MCVDGLKREDYFGSLVRTDSITATTTFSGPLADNFVSKVASISAAVIDSDTTTLTSGSKWITFRSAFAAPPFVIPQLAFDARTALGATSTRWISAGSVAPGSFLLLGSSMVGAGTAGVVNWIAIGSR